MELRQLRYFVAMVETGSLMKAAERLNVAQPALSVHLSNLEVELDTKLLLRSSRGVAMTGDGKLLYERAVEMLRAHGDALRLFRDRKSAPRGRISLGLPSDLTGLLAPDIYRILRDELPHVSVYIADASSAVLFDWLDRGRLDLAMVFNVPDDCGLDLEPLYVEDYALVGLPQAGEPDDVPFDALFDHALIAPCPSTSWRKVFDEIAGRRGKAMRPVIETESFSAIRSIVLSGACRAILPRLSVHEDVLRGRLRARRIVDPALSGQQSIASLQGRELTHAGREVRDAVRRSVETLMGRVGPETGGDDVSLRKVVPSPVFTPARWEAPGA